MVGGRASGMRETNRADALRSVEIDRAARLWQWPHALAEHTLEDRIDLSEVMVEVEIVREFLVRARLAHVGVRREQREVAALAAPDALGFARDHAIGVPARDAMRVW